MKYQYIIETHPLVKACRMVEDAAIDLHKEYFAASKQDTPRAWKAYYLARRVAERIVAQIPGTPECWE